MNSKHRRDQFVKNASLTVGLRCERELAQRLCDYAREHVRADPAQPASRTNPGNVSEAARYLIRRGLGVSHDAANRTEVVENKYVCGLPGLALDLDTIARLRDYQDRHGLTKAGSARHTLRLGLGFDASESLERERHFAAIAAAKHEIMKTQEES